MLFRLMFVQPSVFVCLYLWPVHAALVPRSVHVSLCMYVNRYIQFLLLWQLTWLLLPHLLLLSKQAGIFTKGVYKVNLLIHSDCPFPLWKGFTCHVFANCRSFSDQNVIGTFSHLKYLDLFLSSTSLLPKEENVQRLIVSQLCKTARLTLCSATWIQNQVWEGQWCWTRFICNLKLCCKAVNISQCFGSITTILTLFN